MTGMFTILPEKEETFCAPILERCGADGREPAVLVARCGGEKLGYVALDLLDGQVRILEVVLYGKELDKLSGEEKDLADSMVKAAASYGLNRQVFRAVCRQKSLFPLLKQFGFEQIDDKMAIDFSQLIRKCKNCRSF